MNERKLVKLKEWHKENREGSFFAKLRSWFRWRFLNKDYCPICESLQKWKWHRSPHILPEDPPLFWWWKCKSCGYETPADSLVPELLEEFLNE